MSLIACTGCQRHVRSDETSCPFCGAGVVAPPPGPPRTIGRLGRAALFAFGATLGATTAGCVDSAVPLYGAPAVDAGADASNPAPLYGGAPVDAGSEPDASSSVALYGGAPEP